MIKQESKSNNEVVFISTLTDIKYKITSQGQVFIKKCNLGWEDITDTLDTSDGYKILPEKLYDNSLLSTYVHKAVYHEFRKLGDRHYSGVHHKNGDKNCNEITNLIGYESREEHWLWETVTATANKFNNKRIRYTISELNNFIIKDSFDGKKTKWITINNHFPCKVMCEKLRLENSDFDTLIEKLKELDSSTRCTLTLNFLSDFIDNNIPSDEVYYDIKNHLNWIIDIDEENI